MASHDCTHTTEPGTVCHACYERDCLPCQVLDVLDANRRLTAERDRYLKALNEIDELGNLTDTKFHKVSGLALIFKGVSKALNP